MFSEEFARLAAKFFGPFNLFVAFPGVAWMLFDVTRKEYSRGAPLNLRQDLANCLLAISFGVAGVIFCRYGYGWFGGKKEK